MTYIVTVLEARVEEVRTKDLRAAYREAQKGPFPPGLIRSMLLRAADDPTSWRIETTWASREDLEAMRGAGTPRGVQMFEAAGASPSLGVFEVVATLAPPEGT